MIDITILTDARYVNPTVTDEYTENVLLEDGLIQKALEKVGLKTHRTNWDDETFDWSSTRHVLFRTTWDYFDRFDEFSIWLEKVSLQTKLINEKELIYWNIDKHYMLDLKSKGINIPNSIFIETGDNRTLSNLISDLNWSEFILKPSISGAARHTYRFKKSEVSNHEEVYKSLIQNESMIVQEFQENIMPKGEVAYMVFGGKYSHAILKKAKSGDFRVQDDFGGSVHHYSPNEDEIKFVEQAFSAVDPTPIYARIDVIWDNNNNLAIGEIELIEPELWFRMDDAAADNLAQSIKLHLEKTEAS